MPKKWRRRLGERRLRRGPVDVLGLHRPDLGQEIVDLSGLGFRPLGWLPGGLQDVSEHLGGSDIGEEHVDGLA